MKSQNEFLNMGENEPFEPIGTLKLYPEMPKYVVRFENMYNDLMSIPFIEENFNELSKILYEIKLNPNRYKIQYVESIEKPYSSFYTQELADIVWEHKKFEFEFWGYSRDSWKTLIG